MLSIYHWFGYMKGEALYKMIQQAGFTSTTLWWGERLEEIYHT